jgi:tetratricopeptide (TPR) repeat protein
MKGCFMEVLKLRKQFFALVLLIVYAANLNVLFAQNDINKPTRQSSLEAFSKGNYEQAYREFSELLLTYSRDPLYKYYSGVCLVKLNRNPQEAIKLLKEALNNASVVKTLPPDALFYLGRAQQLSGSFSEAIGSYNIYTEEVGKRKAREQNVPGLIQQCRNNQGKIQTGMVAADSVDKNKVEPLNNEPVIRTVEKKVERREELPAGYEKILDEALILQTKADSLTSLASEQKKGLEKLSNEEKTTLKAKIAENESLAVTYQKIADQKYNQAQAAMNIKQDSSGLKETPISDQLPKQVKQEIVNQPSGNTNLKLSDSTELKTDNKFVKQVETKDAVVGPVKKPIETFKYFDILPEQKTVSDEKIQIDPDVPSGLIYRIQVAVFRNPVARSYFKGITPVFGFRVTGTDKTNYYAGMFRRSSDAAQALTLIKTKGFRDAFIVAFSEKKPVSSERAKALEQEWGNKPFINMVDVAPEAEVDTLPPTLSFRVEVARSQKPLKEDITAGLIKIAGSRGMDILTLNDGNIVYLIGNFITFDSAAEYADLLVRNGYKEAKVAAWLGKKEIPVDTARQLFDGLK